MIDLHLQSEIRRFLEEDIGTGDLTTSSLPGLAARNIEARFIARDGGILAGLHFALETFRILSPKVEWAGVFFKDGDPMSPGAEIASIKGPASAILSGERTALNILQRLSGIATETKRYTETLEGRQTRLLDTRKTTPGFRRFEKYAVRVGGGMNHRLGLFDGVIIKDNHIAVAGGILESVRQVRRNVPVTVRVEVETETLGQVGEALEAGADIIMLDNMSLETVAEAVKLVAGRAFTEVSGGVLLENLAGLAAAGVDFVSTSAIITRARWLDIGLDM